MGSDDFFKKKKAERAARKHEQRQPKPNAFLIVTEGTKTEPNYFNGVKSYIQSKYGGQIDVQSLPEITTEGKGMSTGRLVEEALKLVSAANIQYAQVWVVFDKDDNSDFNAAIQQAENYKFGVAWSNASFEYWIYAHFNFSDTALHRDDWVAKVNQIFARRGINKGRYSKSIPSIFSLCTKHGSLKNAIANTKSIHEQHCASRKKPDRCDPCSTVYKLIEEFSPYLDELLK